MSTYILYGLALILLSFSYFQDRSKTKMALKKAWKAFANILPEFLGVIMLIGIILAWLDPTVISKIIGAESGWLGVILAAVVGTVALIPGFVAFPTAAMLLNGGAGLTQIAAFISTLMMVGVVTLPLETKYFGKKIAVIRNVIAFFFSFLVAFIIGKVVG